MSSYYRRLPIYLLLDCSESMAGEAFDAMQKGIATMMDDLRCDPMALETAFVSIISFASSAKQLLPLTEAYKLASPTLPMGSGTALGAALKLWQDCMTRDVVKTSATQKGDYKPLCFILTDGTPTDAWEKIADNVRINIVGKKANVIAVALGADADTAALHRITETVLTLLDPGPGTFKQFFKWVSSSISTASQKLEGAGEKGMALPNLTAELEIAKPTAASSRTADRFVFLHARCVDNGKFYLMRFEKDDVDDDDSNYNGVQSHVVPNFQLDEEGEDEDAEIDATRLTNPPECPHCNNELWAKCSCGRVHCCPQYSGGSITLTCPWCKTTQQYSPQSFNIGSGRG